MSADAIVRLRGALAYERAADVIDGCDCTLREKLLGDGCEVCHPEMATDIAVDAVAREIARLETAYAIQLQFTADFERMIAKPCEVCGHEGDLFLVCGFCRDAAAERRGG